MTRDEALLWMIALDYAACEAADLEEHEFLLEWWREMRTYWSVAI